MMGSTYVTTPSKSNRNNNPTRAFLDYLKMIASSSDDADDEKLLRQALEDPDLSSSDDGEDEETNNEPLSLSLPVPVPVPVPGVVEPSVANTPLDESPCSSPVYSPFSIVYWWNEGIRRTFPVLLLLAILVLWPCGVVAFHSFQQHTDSTFHSPIPGSLSQAAQLAFTRAFPQDFNDPMHPVLIVVLHSNADQVHLKQNDYARNFSLGLQGALSDSIHTPDSTTSTSWVRATSYFSFQQANLTMLGDQMMSPDGKTGMIQIQYLLPDDNDDNDDANQTTSSIVDPVQPLLDLMEALQDYRTQHPPPEDIEVMFTGLKYFSSDLRASTKHDLKRMDVLVLPVALVLVGLVLPHANPWVVWIVPLVGIISTVCSWSLIMNQVAQRMQITQFTPSIMMSLTLGMGIDYTLFLLARYLEAVHQRASRSQAIYDMLWHGGKVVVMSGITLMCTFLGLLFLPLQMLKSVGVGAAVSIACAILLNLLLVPALLYTRLGIWIVRTDDNSSILVPDEGLSDEDLLTEPLLENGEEIEGQLLQNEQMLPTTLLIPRKSVWTWLSKHLLHPYKSIICLLLTFQFILYPAAKNASSLKSDSISFDLLLPTNAPSLKAYHYLEDLGGPGRLAPFRLLFDGSRSNIQMDSSLGFDIMHQVVQELLHQDSESSTLAQSKDVSFSFFANETLLASTTAVKFSGISVLRNVPIPHSVYTAAKICTHTPGYTCPIESMRVLDILDGTMTSQNRQATFLTAELSASPFSDQGVTWLDKCRETLWRLNETDSLRGVDVYLEGSAAIAHDAVTAVYQNFPFVVFITTAVVFLLMGLFFGSFVPPLRSIVSISCTLAFSFGLAVLVYQDGLWDWTNIRSLIAVEGDICWLVPVMSFSIIVGLALDYDVFLVSRILEFRLDGYHHQSSIVAGLDATGGIITAAGVIMAISFGSLLGSQSPGMYQWSFLLTTAVLLDTFVIRSIVVPILTGLAGPKYCWYPRELPQGRVRFDGYDGEEECNQ
jgi:uncharacterized membrane protein YdfJ with MMPL/SSD domain